MGKEARKASDGGGRLLGTRDAVIVYGSLLEAWDRDC
jgi:hypothetical protein